MKNDLISRQWLKECVDEGWIKFDTEEDENRFIHLVRDIAPSAQPKDECEYWDSESSFCALHRSSAQPGQRNARVFQGIIVEYPSISAYPEYEGKPYFSIKYTENGQEFIGYGTYKPEVLSEYLKEYFMPPTQPECEDAVSREAVLNEIHRYMEERDYTIGLLDDNVCGMPPVTPKQPGWIPWDSGGFPEESGTYTVTAYDGATKRVTYAKYQKRLKRWELTGSRAYWKVLAWQPLPTPYREGGQE